jgi:hypothetical protein
VSRDGSRHLAATRRPGIVTSECRMAPICGGAKLPHSGVAVALLSGVHPQHDAAG